MSIQFSATIFCTLFSVHCHHSEFYTFSFIHLIWKCILYWWLLRWIAVHCPYPAQQWKPWMHRMAVSRLLEIIRAAHPPTRTRDKRLRVELHGRWATCVDSGFCGNLTLIVCHCFCSHDEWPLQNNDQFPRSWILCQKPRYNKGLRGFDVDVPWWITWITKQISFIFYFLY